MRAGARESEHTHTHTHRPAIRFLVALECVSAISDLIVHVAVAAAAAGAGAGAAGAAAAAGAGDGAGAAAVAAAAAAAAACIVPRLVAATCATTAANCAMIPSTEWF